MPFLDFAANLATRAGTTVAAYSVPLNDIGRGDDGEDSGLDAFISGEGAQIKNNASRLGLVISNGSDDQAHVKFITSATVDGLAVEDRIVSIPAGGMVLVGPFTSSYESTNRVDSGASPAVESTNYIKMQFAVDSDSGTETLELGDITVIPVVVPAG